MPAGKYVTTNEVAIIKQHFPAGGAKACRAHIDRTEGAIRNIAWRQGIKRDMDILSNQRRDFISQSWKWMQH